MRARTQLAAAAALAATLLAAPAPAAAAAVITIVNGDGPGEGFNDPTPAPPAPGNAGTTVGAQRVAAFERAAELWGATLDSTVEIQILANFDPLACTATTAVLGSAGALAIANDFPGAEFPATLYPIALANKRAGGDLIPEDLPVTGGVISRFDLRARFNAAIGQPGCLTGSGWYYGLDANEPANQIDLVAVLLHEFAHGLGFAGFASVTTGAQPGGLDDIYSRYYFDVSRGKFRRELTDAERVASAVNTRNVVWTGPNVGAAVPATLARGTPLLAVSAPAALAGRYPVGPAIFGAPIGAPGLRGDVALALDAATPAGGPSPTDACSPIENAAEVAGRIALVDRGTCGFVVKVKNAQDAGAVAVLVADNVAGSPPPGLGGADPAITIPSARITLALGNAIKAQLAGTIVTVTLGLDLDVRAGADPAGRALLNTPDPVQPGSSVSHWDPIASPSQLMEPAINPDLTHALAPPVDLTAVQMLDIGWFPDRDLDVVDDRADACPASVLAPTVVIGGIDTGVPNLLLPNGCTVKDLELACAAANPEHGHYVSCVGEVGKALRDAGLVTGEQRGALQSAAGRSRPDRP
jgi:hypothetical protein